MDIAIHEIYGELERRGIDRKMIKIKLFNEDILGVRIPLHRAYLIKDVLARAEVFGSVWKSPKFDALVLEIRAEYWRQVFQPQ